eukprot:gene41286-51117_t
MTQATIAPLVLHMPAPSASELKAARVAAGLSQGTGGSQVVQKGSAMHGLGHLFKKWDAGPKRAKADWVRVPNGCKVAWPSRAVCRALRARGRPATGLPAMAQAPHMAESATAHALRATAARPPARSAPLVASAKRSHASAHPNDSDGESF